MASTPNSKPVGSPASPSKATFKHSLPATYNDGYFSTLANGANDVPQYNKEHLTVSKHLIACCQMAAVGFSPASNLGPASNTLATGKPLTSPQRDQYNGPLQAFLQHPVSSFGRPAVWQQWVRSRDQLVEHFTAFARRAFNNEVRTVDTPAAADGGKAGEAASPNLQSNRSFHGGFSGSFAKMPGDEGSPINSRRSSQAPSPMNRRPTVAPGMSSEVQDTDVYIRCGLNSFFDPERMVMVHIWDNPRCARAFIHQWRRVAQNLFERRLTMFHSPISVVFSVDCTFVSVTAVPPTLSSARWAPIQDAGRFDSSEGAKTLMHHDAAQLIQSLRCDDRDAMPEVGLSLYPGVDGRFYLLDLHPSLFPSFDDALMAPDTVIPRTELLYLRIGEKKVDSMPLALFAEEVAIPKLIDGCAAKIASDPNASVDVLIRDNFLTQEFHLLGLNMHFLGKVHTAVSERLASGSGTNSAAALKMLAGAIVTELIGRTLKAMIRLDCHHGAAGGRDRDLVKHCSNQKARLDVINRIARGVVGKKDDFLQNHVLPLLRKKFDLPDFSTVWSAVSPGTCLKILSARFGCEFGPAEGRFYRFVPFSSKDLVMVACNEPLESLLCEDAASAEASCRDMWNLAEACPSTDSLLYEGLLVRAIVASAMTNTCKAKIPLKYVTSDEGDTLPKFFLLQLRGLFTDILTKETLSPDHLEAYLQELRSQMVESKARAGDQLTPEVTHYSLRLIQAASVIEGLDSNRKSTRADPGRLEEGVKVFVDQPQTDFVYSAQHAQALRDIEAMIPVLTYEQLQDYLSDTVESIIAALTRSGRTVNAAKYALRVGTKLVGVPAAESCPGAAKLSRQCYSLHVKGYGSDDPRTAVALYLLSLLSMTGAKLGDGAASTISGCRKVLQKSLQLPAQQQANFYRTWNVFSILQKVYTSLDSVGDAVATVSLKAHVQLLSRLHGAAILMQSCGRAYMVRKRKNDNFVGHPETPVLNVSIVSLKSPDGPFSPLSGSNSGSFASSPKQWGAGNNSFNLPPPLPPQASQKKQPHLPGQVVDHRDQPHGSPTTKDGVAIQNLDDSDEEGLDVDVKGLGNSPKQHDPVLFRRKPTFSHNPTTSPPLARQGSISGSPTRMLVLQDADSDSNPKGRAGTADDDDEDNSASLFKLCDTDEDGFVTSDDCINVFTSFNVMSPSELRALFNSAARSAAAGGGRMNFKEFSVVVSKAGF